MLSLRCLLLYKLMFTLNLYLSIILAEFILVLLMNEYLKLVQVEANKYRYQKRVQSTKYIINLNRNIMLQL